jgi:hypothetical protein
MAIALRGQASGNASTFSEADSPAIRPTGQQAVTWSVSASEIWLEQQVLLTPDLTSIVQEAVDRVDWRSGNALAVISGNAGRTDPPLASRNVFAFELRPAEGRETRLLVRYQPPGIPEPDFLMYVPLVLRESP